MPETQEEGEGDNKPLTVKELENLYPNYTWRYTSERAKTKHAIQLLADEAVQGRLARCKGGPTWYAEFWLGTGSQLEYERNDELPPCRRCIYSLERDIKLAEEAREKVKKLQRK